MHPELVMHPEIARAGSFWRSRLNAFLLASLLAHVAIIIGLPDFLPRFDPPGASALEVTILAPQPIPAPAAAPEPPQARPPGEPIARAPRPEPEKKALPDTRQAAGGAPAAGPAAQTQDTEIVGSFPVAPSRGIAPLAAVPDPAAAAATLQVTPPSFDAAYLSNPAPQYPQAARRAGQQGTVTLRVLVLRNGLPSRVELEKSSGSKLLDAAAQDAVWGWRFVPARHGTDPVESWVLVPVVFRLEGTL
jgi:protein TonB